MKRSSFILLALSVVFCASTWMYVSRVLVPQQIAYSEVHGTPRGNLSDLYPRWLGSRELLLHGRDPYSPEITREIQIGYYGRPLDPSRPYDPADQEAFAYPVYVALLLAPTFLLFGLLGGLATFWFSPIGNWVSRKHEYEADAFARKAMGGPAPLVSALRKMSQKNLSNLTPHPLYSTFHYSHPTLVERERALQS